MKQLILLLAAICLVLTGEVKSQNWVVYNTTNSNIPDNTVKCIAIDNHGNKWLGTEKGLAKFDGNTWTTYDTLNSDLPCNNITSLAIDRDGNKWIGTYQYDSTYNIKAALAKFDGSNWTVYDTSNSKLRNRAIKEIAIDSSGHKWFGYTYGLLKLEDTSWTVYNTSNTPLLADGVLEITVDKDGKKWISVGNYGWFSTRHGALAIYDDTTWIVYDYQNPQLGTRFVNSIASDDDGNQWMGGYGFAKFDDTGWTRYDTINSEVLSVALGDFNNKWLGLYNSVGPAMAKFDGINWSFFDKSNSGLPSNSIYQITVDKYNNKWLATSGGLVAYNENGVFVKGNKQTENIFTVFPNPTTNSFQIKCLTAGSVGSKVEVYDMSGKMLISRKYDNDSPTINIENLTPGIYFVKLIVQGQSAVRKVVKL